MAIALLVLGLPSCGDRPSLRVGERCSFNSDCDADLVCRLERCRRECASTRDCPVGSICLSDEAGLGVCRTASEDECELNSDCDAPLVCRFGECTNECRTEADCTAGALCRVDGEGNRGCVDSAEQPCVYNHQCPELLICAVDYRCREQCVEDRDCRDGATCQTMMDSEGRQRMVCVRPSRMDAGVDGGSDAAVDGGGDAGLDAGGDAGADGGTDSGTDAGVDGGSPPVLAESRTLARLGGARHTCRVASSGVMDCWGLNANGQLGDGSTTDSTTPVRLASPTGVVEGVAGARHTCAHDGTTMWCWGDNATGQLGNGTTTPSTTPVALSLPSPPAQLAAGDDHTCVLDTTGTVLCWGSNSSGQLGNGSTTDASTPTPAGGFAGTVVQIEARNDTTCALLADRRVQCWGSNAFGNVGDGTCCADALTPAVVSGISTAIQVEVGNEHTCALLEDGTARCWGRNIYGQLGNGGTADSAVPVAVTSLGGVIQIGAGLTHTCALLGTGEVWCWGSNLSQQLGVDPALVYPQSAVPVSVAVSDIVQLGAGGDHNCAMSDAAPDLIYCWGDDSGGQLGNGGATTTTYVPQRVAFP